MAAMEESSVADIRRRVVADAVARIRRIEETEGVNKASMEKIKAEMMRLADRKDLFPESDFPYPDGDSVQVRYLVHEEPGDQFTMYMNSMKPGKTANPHDHSDSWAVVVAVEGEEVNKVWTVVEEDRAAGTAKLALAEEVVVKPGVGMAFLPYEVHSIAVVGKDPTMHLHLYRKSLESLTGRRGYNMERGIVYDFAAPGKTVGKA